MRPRRLIVLFVVMFGLVAARWWASDSSSAVPLVEAVAHARPLSAASDRFDALSTPAVSSPASQVAALEGVATGDDPLGDPFAVRHPPQPIAPPSPPPPPTAAAPEAAPAQDPAPPYQVIGTYDDSHSPGVFVATPSGVEIARVGGRLGTDFKVIAITRQSLTLEQMATKREVVLNIPGGTAR